MKFTLSDNPISRLSCLLDNKKEELSEIIWRKGKQKTIECRICGDTLDSYKDKYSPMQCGWHKVNKYSWICHCCFDHRNFRPFIEMIDEADRKFYEERDMKIEKMRTKSQEIIDLLKEYLPEYKDTLDTYKFCTDVIYFDDNGNFLENDFSFSIVDKYEKYVLDINNCGVNKCLVDKPNRLVNIASYLDEEVAKQCTFENPWSWDDAIAVINKQITGQ